MFGGVVVLMVAGWFAVRKRIHAELMDTILDDDGAEAPGTDGNAAGTS